MNLQHSQDRNALTVTDADSGKTVTILKGVDGAHVDARLNKYDVFAGDGKFLKSTRSAEQARAVAENYFKLPAASQHEDYSDWHPSKHVSPAGALALLIIAAVLLVAVLGAPVVASVFLVGRFW